MSSKNLFNRKMHYVKLGKNPMKGKEFLAKFLLEKGINEVFSLPGMHTLALLRELLENGIKIYTGRCERSLIFMADGYSRASGKTSVVIVTPGPGLLNTAAGFLEANDSQVPILVIHVDLDDKVKGKGALHEVKDPEKIFSSISKSTLRAKDPSDLPSLLEKAYSLTLSGRRSPVLFSFPYSFLDKDLDLRIDRSEEKKNELFYSGSLEELGEFVSDKKRPLIICGSSTHHRNLRERIEEFCLNLGIPLVTTTGGKGVIDERRVFVFGNVMQRWVIDRLLSNADLVIAFGTRLRDVETKRRGVKVLRLIHIDVEKEYFDINYRADFKIWGDLKRALNLLFTLFKGKNFDWDIHGLKKDYLRELGKLEDKAGFRIIKEIRRSIPDDTITVWDLNMLSYWAEYYFPTYCEASFLLPRGSSTIFWGLPASVGAKLAQKRRPVLCVVGDGGFLPSSAELATVTMYRIPLVILLYNNFSFGILKSSMEKRFGDGSPMELVNPDFVHLARSYGIEAERVKSVEAMGEALRKLTWDKPFLLEFQFPLFENPWEPPNR